MTEKPYVVRILLGAALMLCLAGCGMENNTVPSTTAALRMETTVATTVQVTLPQDATEATAAQAEADLTENAATEASQTEPAQTDPPQTDPPYTEPAQTEPVQTEPAQTEPVYVEQIQAQPVIDRTVAVLAGRMPESSYDPAWSGGTVVQLPVPLGQTEEAMADMLAGSMLDLFADAYADEDTQDNGCTYSLTYSGHAEDGSSHLFVVSYTVIGQTVTEPDFDGGAVVAQVTQGVLNSAQVTVSAFDGNGYAECVTIREVPYFYSTQDAVDYLIGAVETEIYTKNILGAEYSEFCLVYDSKEETCHVFLLYLK